MLKPLLCFFNPILEPVAKPDLAQPLLTQPPLDYFVSRPPVCRILSPCHALALRRICLNMESEAACNAGCLETDPLLGHIGSFSSGRSEVGNFIPRRWSQLQGLIPFWVYPCALNTARLGTQRPQHLEQEVPEFLWNNCFPDSPTSKPDPKRGWCGLPRRCICRRLTLQVTPQEKWILQYITHPLTPCTLHQSSDGSNPTLSLTVSQGTGNVTKRQKIKVINPQVVGRNTARKHNSEIPSPPHKLKKMSDVPWAIYCSVWAFVSSTGQLNREFLGDIPNTDTALKVSRQGDAQRGLVVSCSMATFLKCASCLTGRSRSDMDTQPRLISHTFISPSCDLQ